MRKISRWMLAAITLFFVIWAGGFGVFLLAIPQTVIDKQTKTKAIVVLTGGPERVKTGYQLLETKHADMIFISGVNREETVKSIFKPLKASGIITPENREHLAFLTYLGYEAQNTRQNAEETAGWVKRTGVTSLRLVTAAYHMPRSLLEVKRLVPDVLVIPHPVFPHGFNPRRFWKSQGGFFLVFSEYHKYLWAFVRIKIGYTPFR